jgi:uncharacterized protein (AIM24 family)
MGGDPNATLNEGTTQEGIAYKCLSKGSGSILWLKMPMGTEVRCEPGAMVAFNGHTELISSKREGGFFAGWNRGLAGEAARMTTWGAKTGPGELYLTSSKCMAAIHLDGSTEWFLEKGGFLACTGNIQIGSKSQGFSAGLASNEGFSQVHVTGRGTVFMEANGLVHGIQVAAGESLSVDNGNLAAWPCNQKYKMESAAKSGWTSWKSGEGYVCRFTGPALVYIHGGHYTPPPR